MPSRTPEASSSLMNLQLDRLTGKGTIEANGKSIDFDLGPLILPPSKRIPTTHSHSRILTKEDMEYLDAYEKVCRHVLTMRVNVVGASNSEWPSNTKSDENSYSLMKEEAIQIGEFNYATSYTLNIDNIRMPDLQERATRAGAGLQRMARSRAEENEIREQVDSLRSEIDIIELELIDGPQR